MKAKTILAALVLSCMTMAAVVWLGPVYRDNRNTRESLRRLEASLNAQTRETNRLNRDLVKLRTDCRAIERVAREKFGLCRAEEIIYHFDPPTSTARGAEAAAARTAEQGRE